jgi:hypothetical protein
VRLAQRQASASAFKIAGGGGEHLFARRRDAVNVAEVDGHGHVSLSVNEVPERGGEARCRRRVQGSDDGDDDRALGPSDGDCRIAVRRVARVPAPSRPMEAHRSSRG